ncbi:hypothetical protein CHCC15543_4494 [Bacillus licheniformis]|nr:hypothetical protein CHCC15543_4494 [Bacillus licheniformis]
MKKIHLADTHLTDSGQTEKLNEPLKGGFILVYLLNYILTLFHAIYKLNSSFALPSVEHLEA